MSSIRERIASNIEDVLRVTEGTNGHFHKVVRSPIDIADLARTSFPVAVLTSANEEREDNSMGGSAITRIGEITYWVDVHVWGEERDQEMNNLIDFVEEALDADRTRNGNALDTVIETITLLEPTSASPWTSCRMFVNVQYCFTRGVT